MRGNIWHIWKTCNRQKLVDLQTIATKLIEGTLFEGEEVPCFGGVTCISPTDCVKKCVAEAKSCWAEYAAYPYKPDQMGDLYDCIDSFPKAMYGGSYTCRYQYPNGDACIFAFPTKLGLLTFPSAPPLCEYKSP